MHHAVEIDGSAYWDGGFSANPDLVTLALESQVDDTLIVKMTPLVNEEPADQRARHLESRQLADLQRAAIARYRDHYGGARDAGAILPKGRRAPRSHRFHLIDAAGAAQHGPETKLKPDWA